MNVANSENRIEENLAKSVMVASHRRSGTHLVIDSLRLNFPQRFAKDRWGSYINLDHVNRRYGSRLSLYDVYAALERQPRIFKTHTHSLLWDFFEQDQKVVALIHRLLSTGRVIYVYRDGRDTLVSLYHYACSFNERIAAKKFSEFIRMSNDFDSRTCPQPMGRADYWAWHVKGWSANENVNSVAFEQLTQDFASTLTQFVHSLRLEHPTTYVSPVRSGRPVHSRWTYPYQLWKRMRSWFPSLSRYTAVEFRSGLSGGYRTMFSDDDLQFFDRRAADVMTALGYYTSEDENEA